jgi:hypothetical protein
VSEWKVLASFDEAILKAANATLPPKGNVNKQPAKPKPKGRIRKGKWQYPDQGRHFDTSLFQ